MDIHKHISYLGSESFNSSSLSFSISNLSGSCFSSLWLNMDREWTKHLIHFYITCLSSTLLYVHIRFLWTVWRWMNVLVFGEGGFVAGDLFELPSLLSDCLLHTASRGGYTLQRHISAARAHNRVWITLYPDSQCFVHIDRPLNTWFFSHWLTHYSFPLRHRAFWGLELSVQRVSRRWSWEGRSDFCSSRWHLPPRTPPGRWRWQCQTHSLWCSSLWGEKTKSKWPNPFDMRDKILFMCN